MFAALLACSVCGCDPSGGVLSLDRPMMSELRVAVEDRYLEKESGVVQDGSREGEREDRLNLRVQYSPPVPRLSFQLDVPIYAWKTHFGPTDAQDDVSRGLSDVAISARWEALKIGGMVPRHVLALIGTLKLPTGGNSHLAAVDGGEIDEHKQVGTGTWDETIGAWYTFGDFPTVAYAGVSARVNGTNSRGNHYGNALFATLGVRRSFLDDKRLYFAADAQGRHAGFDTTPEGAYDPNSGGFVGYAVAAAGYAITQDLLVRAVLQLPVITALNGVQSEHPVGYVALAYDLQL